MNLLRIGRLQVILTRSWLGLQSVIGLRRELPDMAFAKAMEIVSSHSVVVFSKSYCPLCENVKKLLSQLGASFKAIELDKESDGSELQTALLEWTLQHTLPNVFIAGKHFGSYDLITALHSEGKLVPLLTEARAMA